MTIFLKDSQSIKQKLRELFSSRTRHRRRVICVAYVAADGSSLLPDYEGVELFCWPQPGATDPRALSQIKQLGATVRLVDHLHAKLYWVEGEGYVLTSANLSASALSKGGHYETGLFDTDWKKVPISSMITSLKSRPLRPAELHKLQREHDLYWSGQKRPFQARSGKVESFTDWFEGDRLPEWKLAWYDTPAKEAADSTMAAAKKSYGVEDIEDYMDFDMGQAEPGDWLLTYLVRRKAVSDPQWMYVDFINPLEESEITEKDLTHQAVQVRKTRFPMRPPFACNGKLFEDAFRGAVLEYGLRRLMNQIHPGRCFLEVLAQHYGRTLRA